MRYLLGFVNINLEAEQIALDKNMRHGLLGLFDTIAARPHVGERQRSEALRLLALLFGPVF